MQQQMITSTLATLDISTTAPETSAENIHIDLSLQC